MRETGSLPRLRDKRKKKTKYALVVTVGVLLVGAGLLLYALRLPFFVVTDVRVVGTEHVDADLVKNAVHEATGGVYLGLIPVAQRFFYPHQSVADAITSVSSRIKDVHVDVTAQTAFVNVSEYVIYALWCRDGENGSCYFIDDSGRVFADAPHIEGTSILRYFGGVASTSPIEAGMYYAGDESAFREIRYLINQLGPLGITPVSARLDGAESLSIVSARGTEFLIGRREDFGDALQRIAIAFDDPSIPVHDLYVSGDLQRLDVRFPGRIVFKERESYGDK